MYVKYNHEIKISSWNIMSKEIKEFLYIYISKLNAIEIETLKHAKKEEPFRAPSATFCFTNAYIAYDTIELITEIMQKSI